MGAGFDVVVIGGGPGGYVAALRAAQLGARTAIVEKDRMGGTCLVRGCIPTKALLQSSELYTLAKDGASGGVVGMEFAAMFAALGSKVTVLEMLPQVLSMVDADLVTVYAKHLAKLGGEIHTNSKVSEVVKRNGGVQVHFSTGGEGGSVDADQVLLAVGRVPYTQGLEAEKAGVELERGRVVVDDHLRTTADGVWAIGDVIGGIMLAHVASYEGVCAVENIAGHADRVPDYHAAPNCIYTDPEIAHVGLGENEAKEKGIAVKIGRFPFAAAGRALTLGQTEGFVKVVADAGSGKLLGAHIIGPRATDLIAEATLAIQNGLTLEQIDLTIHAHPTLPESFMEAALAAQGRAIHIPNKRSSPAPQPEQSNNQNQEKQMVAPVKSSSPPPTPSAINPRSLELTKQNRDFLLGLHRQMQLIRRFEERAQEQYTKAKIGGYCHLNIGEEATVVGGILALKANVFDLPVVWFCVNNRYGMGTPVEKASAVADIYKRACAYDMESIQIDGMNLREVMLRTSEIVEKTRKDSVPRFIEALCYRFRGHSVVDPDKYRSAEDKEKWRKADPIVAFEHELEKSGLADEEYYKKVRQEVDAEVRDIIEFADQSPDPNPDDLYKYTYAGQWDNRPELRAARV